MSHSESTTGNYSVTTENGVTIIRFTKHPTLDNVFAIIDITSEDSMPCKRLWDISNGLNLTSSELQQIAEYGKAKYLKPSKIAILATNDLAFGLAGMFKVYRGDEISQTRVFRTNDEAIDWLINDSDK